MSVLFKALQKAEKENEQRQAASGARFDPSRLAGSGAIKMAGGRGVNWRTAGLAAAVVLAVAIAGAFFLVGSPPSSQPTQVAAVTPPVVVTNPPPGTTEVIPVMQPPAAPPATAPAAVTRPAVALASASTAPAPLTEIADAKASETPAVDAALGSAPAAPQVAAAASVPAAPAPAPVKEVAAVRSPAPASPKVPPSPPRKQAMPEIPADSPARMLNPPISVQRAEFELAGVGNAVQVREVSQNAQDNVGAGYSALVNGAYDMSLNFYDRALKDEPQSVLALLGRGAALQKMGKTEEAHSSYQHVLKIDPANREALSNLTVITSERSPAEALAKLADLEKQYPSFSPIKAQIGLAYAKMGAMPQALDYLRRATVLSPESVMYQYNLALVLDHLGQSEQAVSAYEAVLASLSGGRAVPELSATDIERRVRYLRVR